MEGVERITDSAGAEYYSQGFLDLNESVRGFGDGVIAFCTGVEARLSIGGSAKPVDQGSCVVVAVLKPCSFQFYNRSSDPRGRPPPRRAPLALPGLRSGEFKRFPRLPPAEG